MALTRYAHESIRAHFAHSDRPKNVAVDATCGNGYDTAFLCELGFKRVVGFDIQRRAIDITRHRLEDANHDNYQLHNCCHTELGTWLKGDIDCAMFNLGYLPHGDKNITTTAKQSTLAIQQACAQLSRTGLITVLCYPGHPAGRLEEQAISDLVTEFPSAWHVARQQSSSPSETAPVLYLLQRR